jgi:tetratricopeptide (TPR) repeat protein
MLDQFNSGLEEADSHYKVGEILIEQGHDPQSAIARLREALLLNPEHYWARLRLGQALYAAYSDVAQAEDTIERALAIWPNDISRKWPYRFLGDIYRTAAMTEQALNAYQTARKIDPSDETIEHLIQELAPIQEETTSK